MLVHWVMTEACLVSELQGDKRDDLNGNISIKADEAITIVGNAGNCKP